MAQCERPIGVGLRWAGWTRCEDGVLVAGCLNAGGDLPSTLDARSLLYFRDDYEPGNTARGLLCISASRIFVKMQKSECLRERGFCVQV